MTISKTIEDLIDDIQYFAKKRTNKKLTIGEIAESIGYSRPHIQSEMKNNPENPAIMKLLRDKYSDILPKDENTHPPRDALLMEFMNKVIQIEKRLDELQYPKNGSNKNSSHSKAG